MWHVLKTPGRYVGTTIKSLQNPTNFIIQSTWCEKHDAHELQCKSTRAQYHFTFILGLCCAIFESRWRFDVRRAGNRTRMYLTHMNDFCNSSVKKMLPNGITQLNCANPMTEFLIIYNLLKKRDIQAGGYSLLRDSLLPSVAKSLSSTSSTLLYLTTSSTACNRRCVERLNKHNVAIKLQALHTHFYLRHFRKVPRAWVADGCNAIDCWPHALPGSACPLHVPCAEPELIGIEYSQKSAKRARCSTKFFLQSSKRAYILSDRIRCRVLFTPPVPLLRALHLKSPSVFILTQFTHNKTAEGDYVWENPVVEPLSLPGSVF